MSRSRVNAEQTSAEMDEMALQPDSVIHMVGLSDRLIVLTAQGKMYERLPDMRDFATGPNHRPGYNWRLVKGPFDEG